MQTTNFIENYTQQFKAVSDVLPGRDIEWLQAYREEAFRQFQESGFPTIRQENWKYTDVKAIASGIFESQPQATRLDKTTISPYLIPSLDCHLIVFVNGTYQAELSSYDDELPFTNLKAELEKNNPAIRQLLNMSKSAKHAGFEALNSAFMSDGVIINISQHQIIQKPIHLLFIQTETTTSTMNHQRHLVTMAQNSQAHIIESHISLSDKSYFTNHLSRISLGDNAVLYHDVIQKAGVNGLHIDDCHTYQAKDSQYHRFNIDLGAKLARHDTYCYLQNTGAHCALNGLYLTDDKQHIDNHTVINHESPHTTSQECYKGILHGKSRAVFNGRIVVSQDAQKVDATQQNNNLLLSDKAEIDTKPQLEIYADDVKCAHGATVGQLDERALFYLQSRGIPMQAAKDILVFGFAKEMLHHLKQSSLRHYLEKQLIEKLPHKTQIEDLHYDAINAE